MAFELKHTCNPLHLFSSRCMQLRKKWAPIFIHLLPSPWKIKPYRNIHHENIIKKYEQKKLRNILRILYTMIMFYVSQECKIGLTCDHQSVKYNLLTEKNRKPFIISKEIKKHPQNSI